jgi:hypothetical protein
VAQDRDPGRDRQKHNWDINDKVAYHRGHPFVSVVGFFGISRMPPASRIE